MTPNHLKLGGKLLKRPHQGKRLLTECSKYLRVHMVLKRQEDGKRRGLERTFCDGFYDFLKQEHICIQHCTLCVHFFPLELNPLVQWGSLFQFCVCLVSCHYYLFIAVLESKPEPHACQASALFLTYMPSSYSCLFFFNLQNYIK